MPIFEQFFCLVGFASPHFTTDSKGAWTIKSLSVTFRDKI